MKKTQKKKKKLYVRIMSPSLAGHGSVIRNGQLLLFQPLHAQLVEPLLTQKEKLSL